MPNFTDTPVAGKFFAELAAFERVFRDELGPHYEVTRATLPRARMGEYPGIRVRGHRLPEAKMPENLDLFFYWEAVEIAAFVGASATQQSHSLERIRAHLGHDIRMALEEQPIDLEGASQAEPATVWIALQRLGLA